MSDALNRILATSDIGPKSTVGTAGISRDAHRQPNRWNSAPSPKPAIESIPRIHQGVAALVELGAFSTPPEATRGTDPTPSPPAVNVTVPTRWPATTGSV